MITIRTFMQENVSEAVRNEFTMQMDKWDDTATMSTCYDVDVLFNLLKTATEIVENETK